MPIFEYECEDCKSKYEVLHKSSKSDEAVYCPECNSGKSKKLISGFSSVISSGSNGDCSNGSCGYTPSGCAGGMCGLN